MVSFTAFSPSRAAVRETVPWPAGMFASQSRRLWSLKYQRARDSAGYFASAALVPSLRVMPQRVKNSVRFRFATAEAVRATRS